jgi:hypothetical protein
MILLRGRVGGVKMRTWNKMFIIELGPGILYPKQEERWPKYGEPLSRLFAPYFHGDKLFQWFKDDSENFLAGINVACFEFSSKWEESQNEQKEFELFAYLSVPLNDFFIKLGSRANITGLYDIEETAKNLSIEIAEAKLTGAESAFAGQVPVEFDEPDFTRQIKMFNHNERYYIVYSGEITGHKRFKEISKEQAMEIAEADTNQVW